VKRTKGSEPNAWKQAFKMYLAYFTTPMVAKAEILSTYNLPNDNSKLGKASFDVKQLADFRSGLAT